MRLRRVRSFLRNRLGGRAPVRSPRLRKWYFAVNENALRHGFDQVRCAVLSAKARTSLRPICLVGRYEPDPSLDVKVDWLKRQGVAVIRHESALFPLIREARGDDVSVFSGHWLRCDIPLIEQEDDFVLYTDTDVIFLRDAAEIEARPRYVAAAPEHEQDNLTYFNSGVMVMNVPALRLTYPELEAIVRGNAATMKPHDDQIALNGCLHGRWDRLPPAWNWKPYWGVNEAAGIVHFVGPKPGHVRRMLDGEAEIFGDVYARLFGASPEGYRRYVDEFARFQGPVEPDAR